MTPTNMDTLREHLRKAGSVKSDAKAKAARENAKKPRPNRRKKQPEKTV